MVQNTSRAPPGSLSGARSTIAEQSQRSHGISLDQFAEVLSGRLNLSALKNPLILGARTGLFGLIIGLVLAWAVSSTDVPAKPLLQITATLAYLSPPFLTAIAFTYLFSPT